MKKLFLITVVILGTGILIGGGCGWAGINLGRAIVEGQKNVFDQNYPVVRWCGNGLPFVDKLKQMLDKKTYIVLLQNNMELRPTGGFMGSYAKIETEGGVIQNWVVQDIYEPDGKLPGHVEPPYPIQESFRQGWWKLRDSNWDPDFASAAATVAWFFDQGGEKVDGIVGLNLGFIEKWLQIIGPVKVISFDKELNAENFYSLAQAEAEVRIVNNVTRKRDFLGAAGVALVERTKSANLGQLIKLAKLVWGELKNRQLLVWMADGEMEKIVQEKRWGGDLGFYGGDYLYVVEANLGANKSNCCVERKVEQEISGIRNTVKINWINNSKFENPIPPDFWGGNYLNYVRVIVPDKAVIERVKVGETELRRAEARDFDKPNSLRQEYSRDMYTIEKREGLQMIGFWVMVKAGGMELVEIEYKNILRQAQDRFTLRVNRQPGIESFMYKLIVNNKIVWEGLVYKDENIAI